MRLDALPVACTPNTHEGEPMTGTTYEPDPDDAADDDLAAELAGQSTTVEEAMDAVTDEEGFADESAYTPSTVTPDAAEGESTDV
jgi:hypothetical protein